MGVFSRNFSNIFYLNAKSRPPGAGRAAQPVEDNRSLLIDSSYRRIGHRPNGRCPIRGNINHLNTKTIEVRIEY